MGEQLFILLSCKNRPKSYWLVAISNRYMKSPCKGVIKFDLYDFLVPLLLRVSYTDFAQFCSASISSTLTDHHY